MTINNHIKKNLSGFTYVELIISLLLLSLILLGLNAMEVMALRQSSRAWYYQVAVNQADNMLDRLRALKKDTGLDDQIKRWNQENGVILPQGGGIVQGEFPAYTVQVFWKTPPSNQFEFIQENISL